LKDLDDEEENNKEQEEEERDQHPRDASEKHNEKG
jgi:hypothetical protein